MVVYFDQQAITYDTILLSCVPATLSKIVDVDADRTAQQFLFIYF
jgi:hypothetical protein